MLTYNLLTPSLVNHCHLFVFQIDLRYLPARSAKKRKTLCCNLLCPPAKEKRSLSQCIDMYTLNISSLYLVYI